MVADERARHELFQQLERTLGQEAATTLMEHLPPVGWADVATRRDLDVVRQEVRSDIDVLRHEMREGFADIRADFRGEITDAITAQTRLVVLSTLSAVVAVAGLALGLG